MAVETVTIQDEQNEEFAKLFDFWADLPVLLTLESDEYEKLLKPYPRGEILDILVEGMQENHPVTNELRSRRALSASEIMSKLNERASEKGVEEIKKSNLYFHIQKLEDNGLIEARFKVEKGKRTTHYYIRTAKIVTMDAHNKYDDTANILNDKEFLKFLKILNPDVSLDEIQRATRLANKKNDWKKIDILRPWLREHERELRDMDFDMRKLFDLISTLLRFNEKTMEGLNLLSKYLKLDETFKTE